MRILGISAFYHDSAAALVVDGVPVAAAQEERFTRRRHDAGFPRHAIEAVLTQGKVRLRELDHVVFYEKPFLKFERLLETYLAFAPRGFRSFRTAVPLWVKEKLFQKSLLIKALRGIDPGFEPEGRLLFSEHHRSHAASAFYPSPFEEAVVLTMDGAGEWATTTAGVGRGAVLDLVREIQFPHSLGLLYSAFTYYTGFKVNSGEYKVMGLAPYGEPRYRDRILERLIDVRPDGSFWLDIDYFDYCSGLTMTGERFHELFGGPPRRPEEPLTQRHMDLAASIQDVTEEVVLRLTRSLAADFGVPNLCLAGGVALNCVANGRVMRDGRFRGLWIQPAAGDAGAALGAALAVHYGQTGAGREVRRPDAMAGACLGPGYSDAEIGRRLAAAGARFVSMSEPELLARVAAALGGGKVVGWFQGRMEFGPRALGARSILADPRSPSMQKALNLKVKNRESFRPFAPAVLREDAADWFDLDRDSPYMLLVAPVAAGRRRNGSPEEAKLTGIGRLEATRSEIPAVTHVDFSARVQTVDAGVNRLFHALLVAFKGLTGCPVLVNTSFNVRGEPIVATPEDAFRCFMGTDIDCLAIGSAFLVKEEQDPALCREYKQSLPPD